MDKLPRIEVLIGDTRKPPECPHGPCLLFKRIVDGSERLFYACSACRDRKDCRFFLWADEPLSDTKKKHWENEKEKVIPKIQHTKLYVKLMKLAQSSSSSGIYYCHTCSELIGAQDLVKHSKHDLSCKLSEHQLAHPSEILKPLQNAKKEAQYMFSKETCKTIVTSLQSLGIKHVLCIGAPRIHEYILSNTSDVMNSLLLDIDHRYHHFHGPLQFCWYNAFNNHFFNGAESETVVQDFLSQDSGKDIAIVMDPPFGGRVEPLANSIQVLTDQHQALNALAANLSVMWIYPYFMEPHILASLPDFKMMDYKVDYDNHPLFTTGPQGRKFGSPVRIFTNVPLSRIALPPSLGYRRCTPCNRWVGVDNKHCKRCGTCPSKDGRTYVHCDACRRCVKPSWKHCDECERCCMQSHKCGEFVPSEACYHCGVEGHKRADCPSGVAAKKRKIENRDGPKGKVERAVVKAKKIKSSKKRKMKKEMERSGGKVGVQKKGIKNGVVKNGNKKHA